MRTPSPNSSPLSLLAAILLAGMISLPGAGLGGCRVTETRESVHVEQPPIRRASAALLWNVIIEGSPVGEVVFYESALRAADSFYMVRNVWQQELGLIDSLGRAYRFTPHTEEPSWVGTGTVTQGVARILGVDENLVLVEKDLDPVGWEYPVSVPLPPEDEFPR